MKAFKKIALAALVCTLSIVLLSACGKKEESSTTSDSTTKSDVSITILNSKGEIQVALEDMASAFEKETGIKVDVLACGAGEVPYTKITSMYNSGTAPTMAILDPLDIDSLAQSKAVDLTDEEWVAECENSVMRIDGKVYAFPLCIEGRGIIYNKTAVENVLGHEFDPDSIDSYDALKALLEELRAGGMEYPIVISKEDWSLGAHMLGYIYDAYDGTTAGGAELVGKLKSGELSVADYDRFNQLVDTFSLIKEYNYNHADPLGASYDRDPMYLADGDAALWFNGCWAWPNIYDSGADNSDEYGFLPFVLGNEQDFNNTGMQASASKMVMIDKEQSTAEEIEAAKQFIDWIVYSETGQRMLVEDCALIPSCTNNQTASLDPLSLDIRAKMAEGRTYNASTILPSDHWSKLGASMQRFLADTIDRNGLAAEIDAYWAAQN